MSKTNFDKIVGQALLSAYDNTCFYCKKPLDWDSLHIDHIIPESLIDKAGEFIEAKKLYGLDDDFDINCLWNLVPTHMKCNDRKSDVPFDKGTILYFFGLTKQKTEKIQAEIDLSFNRRRKGQIVSKVESCLQAGTLDAKEIEGIIDDFKQNKFESLERKLSKGIDFIDEVFDTFYLNKNYTPLLDKKIKIGGGVFDDLELANGKGGTINVSTLREWNDAKRAGFYPSTTFAIKMSAYFTSLDDLLQALIDAKMPKISFVSEPWVGIENLDLLSPDVICVLGPQQDELDEYIRKGLSIADLEKMGIVNVRKDSNLFKLSIQYKDLTETNLVEMFRADFNNDGIEDIFVQGYCKAIGGSHGHGYTTILTRFSPKHLIEPAKDS